MEAFPPRRHDRRILDLIANQLHELGYKHMQAKSLKAETCRCLGLPVERPGHQRRHVQESTIGASLVGQARSARPTSSRRTTMPTTSAIAATLARNRKPRTRREAVGENLRRVRSLEPPTAGRLRPEARGSHQVLDPNYAIKDDHIKLKASWTKGGRARTVPIRTDEQRKLLEDSQETRQGRRVDPAEQELRRTAPSLRAPGPRRQASRTPTVSGMPTPSDATRS